MLDLFAIIFEQKYSPQKSSMTFPRKKRLPPPKIGALRIAENKSVMCRLTKK